VDVTKSLFGPGSVTWEVNREAVLLAGGGCALLLQVAHPLVAAGVAEHSNFRERPLDRLYRTLDLMLTITFAPAAQAIRAVREIERRHAPVRGYLAEAAGPFVRGTPYRASDPALLFWVHATLVHTAARVFEMFVRPLTAAELARYYDESKVIARLFGVPESDIPPTWRRFQDYFERMVMGEELAVSEQSQAIARAILWPERPLWLRGVMPPARLLSIGLLPEPVRARYGFRWPAWQEHAFRALVAAGQLALTWVPRSLRDFPHAREGHEREPQSSPLDAVRRGKSVAA
jgi:uncharacterized protein (DUF2236 family)